MTPIDQNIYSDKEKGIAGNCLQACIASMLDLPLDSVPHFMQDFPDNPWIAAKKWIKEQGYIVFSFCTTAASVLDSLYIEGVCQNIQGTECFVPRYCILSGPGPRGVNHAVIGQANGYGVKIIHDPHHSREGLLDGHRWVYFFLAKE